MSSLYRDRLVAAFQLLGVGFFIGGAILGGVMGGIWLDERLGYSFPALTLVGLFLGLVVAGVGVYRMLLPLLHSDNRNGGNEGKKEAD